MNKLLNFLKNKVSLFRGLSDSTLKCVMEYIKQPRIYDRGSSVIYQGDRGEGLFISYSGRLKALLRDRNAKEYILSIITPGEYFGEIAMFGNKKRASHVITMDRCELLVIYKDDFMALIDQYPRIAINMLSKVCDMVDCTNELVDGLLFSQADQRIFNTLINLSKNSPESDNGNRIISNISVTDIARMTGTGRPTASKVINDLKRNRYIDVQNKTITILNDSFGV